MHIPLFLIVFYHGLITLIDNLPLLMQIVPKFLQLYGILGWGWQGFQLYQDSRIQYRTKRFFRATLAWTMGILLEFFLERELYLFWTQ